MVWLNFLIWHELLFVRVNQYMNTLRHHLVVTQKIVKIKKIKKIFTLSLFYTECFYHMY